MSNYGNSDAGRLNDLQSVTQKLRGTVAWLYIPQPHEQQKLLYEGDKESAKPQLGKKNCLQIRGLKRVGPRSSFPIHPLSSPPVKRSPLSAALGLGTKGGTGLRQSSRPSELLLDSPLRGDRLRLRPIRSPPQPRATPETTVQQLPGGRGTELSLQPGKRRNESPEFRLLRNAGGAALAQNHAAAARCRLFRALSFRWEQSCPVCSFNPRFEVASPSSLSTVGVKMCCLMLL